MVRGRLCCLVFLLCTAPTWAQTVASPLADDLPRHGVIGLVVVAADSAKPENPQTYPLTVKAVVPGGSPAPTDPSQHIDDGDPRARALVRVAAFCLDWRTIPSVQVPTFVG